MELRPPVLKVSGQLGTGDVGSAPAVFRNMFTRSAFTPDVGGEEGIDRPQMCVPSFLTRLQQDRVGSPGRE